MELIKIMWKLTAVCRTSMSWSRLKFSDRQIKNKMPSELMQKHQKCILSTPSSVLTNSKFSFLELIWLIIQDFITDYKSSMQIQIDSHGNNLIMKCNVKVYISKFTASVKRYFTYRKENSKISIMYLWIDDFIICTT